MTEQHPITPPPELVQQWRTAPEYATGLQKLTMVSMTTDRLQEIATQAARWGADQELEACCEWLRDNGLYETRIDHLRAARRPKPPSLKEQALEALEHILRHSSSELGAETIRRALEALDD